MGMFKFLSDLWEFFKLVSHHWGILVTGGFIVTVITVIEHFTSKSISGRWLVSAVGFSLFLAFFLAWRGERDKRITIERELEEKMRVILELQATKQLGQKEAQQISLQALEQLVEIRKLEPNLVQLGAENLPAYEDDNGVIIVGEINQGETFRAVVIPYHNSEEVRSGFDLKRKVGRIENVSAQITYKYLDSSNSLRIKRGAWLSEKESRVIFGVNETRRLIVATLEGADNKPHIYAIRRDFDSSYKGNIVIREELHGDLIAITVRIIAEAESKPIKTSELILEIAREPLVEVKVQSAQLWKWSRLGNFRSEGYKLSIRICEGEKEEQIVEEVKDWEMRAATFLGQHFGEQQKTNFLDAYPSIEQGLRRHHRLRSHLPRLRENDTRQEFILPYWTLDDSIGARTKILEECEKRL